MESYKVNFFGGTKKEEEADYDAVVSTLRDEWYDKWPNEAGVGLHNSPHIFFSILIHKIV